MKYLYVVISVLFCFVSLNAQTERQQYMLDRVNELRATGCNCGTQYFGPVPSLDWNNTLATSANAHASDMNDNQYFSHFSQDGKDVGERIFDVGYFWSFCGENLGIGQKNYDEVFEDWIDSTSHCKMMMSPEVTEVGIVHVGKFWVQHFAKPFDYASY